MQQNDSLDDITFEVTRLRFCRMHYLLEKTGVHPGQQHLLFSLFNEDGQSQKELASKMKIKPSTLTVMIQRMEKNDFIRREQDKKDQRISRIFITEKGQESCLEAKRVMKQVEDECYKNFTIEEKLLLRRMFIQMRDNLRELKLQDEGNKKSSKKEI